MKVLKLALLVIAFSCMCFCINGEAWAAMSDDDTTKVYIIAEELPVFPGGNQQLFEFLNTNLSYPRYDRKHGIEGVVLTTFVINRDGSISEIEVLESPSERLAEEAKRVIGLMPKWRPGISDGEVVRVRVNFPIQFTLSNRDRKK